MSIVNYVGKTIIDPGKKHSKAMMLLLRFIVFLETS